MTLYVPPRMDTLGDVDLEGLANGNLLTYNTATGKWIVLTRAALTSGLAAGSVTTGNLVAGNFIDVDIVSSNRLVIGFGAQEASPSFAYMPLWECFWRSGAPLNMAGWFAGPEVVAVSGTPPGAPLTGRIRFRFYNREATDHNFLIHYTTMAQ